MRQIRDGDEQDQTLGQRVESEPEEEWRPVDGKPHFYVNRDGRMKYEPPEPQLDLVIQP